MAPYESVEKRPEAPLVVYEGWRVQRLRRDSKKTGWINGHDLDEYDESIELANLVLDDYGSYYQMNNISLTQVTDSLKAEIFQFEIFKVSDDLFPSDFDPDDLKLDTIFANLEDQ